MRSQMLHPSQHGPQVPQQVENGGESGKDKPGSTKSKSASRSSERTGTWAGEVDWPTIVFF